MACTATLKRSLDFDHDSPHRFNKRRRCMPITISRTAAPTKSHQMTASAFANVVPEMTAEELMSRLSQHYKSLTHRRHHFASTSGTNLLTSPSCSPSPNDPTASAANGSLFGKLSAASLLHVHSSMSTGSVTDGCAQRRKDVPLFTLKQVGLVCERMMKEREEQLQEEYEKVLNIKLAEQYEAFLKFNQDQLHRKFGETAASYVS